MTLVDVLIVMLILGAIFRGIEEGFVHQLFSTAGFFVGLLIGAMLEPHVVNLVHTPLARLIVALATTLGCAFFFLFVGELVGILIKHKLTLQQALNRADDSLGAVLASVAMLVVVWLSASVAGSLPYPSLQQEVHGSAIIGVLNRVLPPAPGIIADIGRLIAPNGFPDVFIGAEPAPRPVQLPTPQILAAAVAKDRASVVKVEGEGCGGVVAGSGFVVGSNLVATNAHVVAGIADPMVMDGNGTHRATAIWFDPDLDFAVLRVNGLAGGPLHFDVDTIDRGTPAGVLGYPGGGVFQADRAAILDEISAKGRNIYNQGRTVRDIYSIQATVVPGNSGGPLINTDGDVIGVVFATSTTYDNVGYALSLQKVVGEVNDARNSNQPVSTGTCAE